MNSLHDETSRANIIASKIQGSALAQGRWEICFIPSLFTCGSLFLFSSFNSIKTKYESKLWITVINYNIFYSKAIMIIKYRAVLFSPCVRFLIVCRGDFPNLLWAQIFFFSKVYVIYKLISAYGLFSGCSYSAVICRKQIFFLLWIPRYKLPV